MPNIAITRAKQSDLTELCGCINLENGYNIMYIVCIIIIIIYCIVNNLNSENVLVRRHYNCVPQDSTMAGQLVGIRESPLLFFSY